MLLSGQINISRPSNAVAAGATASNGSGVDMQGYNGVIFIAALGTLTATQVTSLKAQQSDDNGSSDDYTDIEGSKTDAMQDGDSNKMLVVDIYKPTKRYVRPVVNRGTANAVIDGVIAIRYNADRIPLELGAAVAASKALVSPDEGTA